MEMKEITVEVTFPFCEHKENLKITTKDGKRGVENVYRHMVEQRNGLCGECYMKSKE